MCLDHFLTHFEKGYNMWKKNIFLVYIFFFGKKWIICAETFFELFFNKKILFGIKDYNMWLRLFSMC